MSTNTNFEWILSGTDTKGYNVSKSDRIAIRRQAMKKIGNTWRQRANYGRINVGQYPIFVSNDNDDSLVSISSNVAEAGTEQLAERHHVSNRHSSKVLVNARKRATIRFQYLFLDWNV
jgi:hypothetical protein